MRLPFLAAASLLALASPLHAETLEYRVIMQDRDVGHFTVERQQTTASVVFDYKQNGRGPTIAEKLTFDADGTPIDWSITGRTTFGNQVNESFKRTSAGGSWDDQGRGRAALVRIAEWLAHGLAAAVQGAACCAGTYARGRTCRHGNND